ncbi:MAG: NAD(+) diphosphatase [Desulfobulbaceae bacterium]|jgi:NAD+ diphosphatase|nr:NAD(+) diphosphatase [Desulfobulbaceae bacterium]
MSAGPSRFFIRGRKLLFHEGSGALRLYDGPNAGALYQRRLSGGGEVIAVSEETPLPAGCLEVSLRAAYAHLPEPLWIRAGRAIQILDWRNQHSFCGRCGEKTIEQRQELAMLCPSCGLSHYPHLSPAVIMAVTCGDAILLGRARRFPNGMYSVLAGFVELGETLENAVRREVFEETGITIGDIRYFASQPWPFPHSLMIAFTAEAVDRAICLNDGELEDARWFRADSLPLLPDRMSIARRLIDVFLAGSR